MTEVQIMIEDVLGRAPSRGDRLWVRASRTRSGAAGQVVAPVAVPIEVYDNPTIKMEPGPARVRFELRDLAVDQIREFPVTVPVEGPVTLRDILDEAYDWTPEELSAFAQLRADAQAAAQDASGHADRAEAAANEFGLTATTTTGAPGSDAAVTVSGDGPAYTLGFTVPRGAKGDKGDTGTTEWSGINGKPATFPPTIGTTASTAKAGNYVPAWSEVTGKPATFPPATHTHTAADTGAVARQGAATGLWIGTEAALPPTGAAGVLYVTTD